MSIVPVFQTRRPGFRGGVTSPKPLSSESLSDSRPPTASLHPEFRPTWDTLSWGMWKH